MKILGAIASVVIAVAAFPTPLQAQQDDIRLRGAALQACMVEGWLGYGSYEVCVEAVYQDLLNQASTRLDWEYYWGMSWGCSAESRICPR